MAVHRFPSLSDTVSFLISVPLCERSTLALCLSWQQMVRRDRICACQKTCQWTKRSHLIIMLWTASTLWFWGLSLCWKAQIKLDTEGDWQLHLVLFGKKIKGNSVTFTWAIFWKLERLWAHSLKWPIPHVLLTVSHTVLSFSLCGVFLNLLF